MKSRDGHVEALVGIQVEPTPRLSEMTLRRLHTRIDIRVALLVDVLHRVEQDGLQTLAAAQGVGQPWIFRALRGVAESTGQVTTSRFQKFLMAVVVERDTSSDAEDDDALDVELEALALVVEATEEDSG